MRVAHSFVSLLAALACVAFTLRARATYSIAAADTRTHATGGAGTSCLHGDDVYVIYGGVPGLGTVHAQALLNEDARDEGVRLLASGATPSDVIARVTSPAFDAYASLRQYGVVSVTGQSAGFTGADDQAYAADLQGAVGDFVYSVQGNFLTSRAVIDHASAAFEASGCDLPERLLHALEAGADGGEGDHRCTPDGLPSDSAFLEVELPESEPGSYLELRVPSSGNQSPLPELHAKFDRWRASHACPAVSGGDLGATAVSAAADAGGPGTDGQSGCACRLPHGRGPKNAPNPAGFVALASAVLTFRRRAKSPTRVRGSLPRLS
ncbi:MAG TPA: DUF1028 domain-containing protein [Polyangiaceae bacterium]|nr:DUF1028 domain-containing protein [Polyangiaceae bacterium]